MKLKSFFKIISVSVFVFTFIFVFSSCSSKSKKRTSVFSEDSDFLKQGRRIEVFDESSEEKSADKENQKKNIKKSYKKNKTKNKVKKLSRSALKKAIQESHLNKNKPLKEGFVFKEGEKVVLSASFIGVEAGEITIGVDSFKKIGGKKVYNFYAIGKTSSVFSFFYKIKNKIESLWDGDFKRPVSLAFDAQETKQKYKTRVYFDWAKKKADFLEEGWSKKKGDYKKKKTWSLYKPGQDIVSSIFYTRTLPLKVGETYPITVFENSKVIEAKIKVDRKEVLRTRVGKLNTIVIKPSFSIKGKFNKKGDISVWLTDDEYRQVVRIESKIKMGTVTAKLKSLARP